MQQVKLHWKVGNSFLLKWVEVLGDCHGLGCRLITKREFWPPLIYCQSNATHSFCWALVNEEDWCHLRADVSTIPYKGKLFFKSSCPANLSAWIYFSREGGICPFFPAFLGVTFSQLSRSSLSPARFNNQLFLGRMCCSSGFGSICTLNNVNLHYQTSKVWMLPF